MQVNFILVKGPNDAAPIVYFGKGSEKHNDIAKASGVNALFVIASGSALTDEKVFLIGPATQYVAYGPCTKGQLAETKEVKTGGWTTQVSLLQK